MKGKSSRDGISIHGGVVVVLVLAMAISHGIISASAAACPTAGAADCRLVGGGSAAVESAVRTASLTGPAGIVGAPPPWGNGLSNERRDDDRGDAGSGSSKSDDTSRSGPGAADRGETAEDGAGAHGGSDGASGRNGTASGRPTNATHPGDGAGNSSANATGRDPLAAVPAAVNLTARGKSKGRGETLVNASVDEVRKGQRVRINLDARRNALLNRSNASDVAISNIDLTPTRNGSFTMNLTTAERIEGSPEFQTDDGAETLSHVRVEHSISNAELNGTVGIGFEVSKARLENGSVAPENVALYRYENGSWTELPTEVVDETHETVRFRAQSPGLSEFAAGAKRARFSVETVDVAVEEIAAGDNVQVHVTIGNDGGADGEFVAQLILDGTAVEERSLTIAAGGQRQTLFDHTVADAGEYEVRVNDVVAGSVVVRQPVAGTSATEAETTEPGTEPAPTVTGTDVASPLFHPTALVLVILVAIVARVRRR
ncbi:hypothetical protein C474_20736 [Halogeometricum pallidum JCM 14848]|uniref:CARDB domain-containing protein n=1 Tax=Halogeometricum pallidum JCM 14848 TaxID=1227487 RepID=M0CSI1_HALPD|nr:PGF-pre-PGF domain-containing protein [Halogeometricum pallidum]ELZ26166.1 hypothetical protein C474_20736 [Halogeometricum pallidum JCM 14848]